MMTSPLPRASWAIAAGRSLKPHSLFTRTSSSGASRSDSASRSRLAFSQRARCEGETEPTWDALRVSRREWKAPPSATLTGRSPYQLSSRIVASKPATCNASASPSAEPLACTTRSESCVPHRVDGGLQIGSQYSTPRRDPVGHCMCCAQRHEILGLMRIQAEDHFTEAARRAFHDPSDARVAVLDRRRELARLKRRPHAGVLRGRHVAVEHESLGAPADSTVECLYPEVSRSGGRQLLAPQL